MTDTTPKRLRELADSIYPGMPAPRSKEFRELLLALAAEKEAAGCSSFCAPGEPCLVSKDGKCVVCPTCGSDCNERDELLKAEREIARLQAEKEAQNNSEQHLGMVLAVVPLPEPANASMYPYTADDLRQYGQACAKAAKKGAA